MNSLLLLLMTSVWGFTFVTVKDAISEYPIVPFLALRFAIGALCLLPFASRRVSLREWRIGVIVGFSLSLGFLGQTAGLLSTTATNCGLITGLYVVFAPAVSRFAFGVRTKSLVWGAIALSLLGLSLLTGAGAGTLARGDLLTIAGALCFGVHISLLDQHAKKHDTLGLAFTQVVVAAVIFSSVAPFGSALVWPSRLVWFALAITGVLATSAAFFVQTYVQKRISGVRAAMIMVMEPVFAMLFGYVFHHDRLEPIQLFGALLMIGSVLAVEFGPWLAQKWLRLLPRMRRRTVG